MDQNELLQNIKESYYFAEKYDNASTVVNNLEKRSNNLGIQISNYQKLIQKLNNFISNVSNTQITYPEETDVEYEAPIKKYYVIAAIILVVLIGLNIRNGFLQFLLGAIAIVAVVVLYFWRDGSKRQAALNEVNEPIRKRSEQATNDLRQKAQDMIPTVNNYQSYLSELQKIKSNIDKDFLPRAQKQLKAVKDDGIKVMKVPLKRQYDPNFYSSLYEVVDTSQAQNLGEAVRIVEDRFERAELNQNLKNQLVENQTVYKQRLDQLGNQISGKLQQLNQNLSQINQGLVKSTNQLQNINQNLMNVDASITQQTNAIDAYMVQNNITANDIEDSIKDVNSNIKQLNNNAGLINSNLVDLKEIVK